MKKIYENPEVEVTEFEIADIVTASDGYGGDSDVSDIVTTSDGYGGDNDVSNPWSRSDFLITN